MQHVIRKVGQQLVRKHTAAEKVTTSLSNGRDERPRPSAAQHGTAGSLGFGSEEETTNIDVDEFEHLRISPDQPTVVSEDGNRTYRLRKHGNKPLPIPEIMDPIYLEARNRYQTPKAFPVEEDLTPFQQELFLNPYARALAGSVRQCSTTKARLPTHFLTPFALRFPAGEEGQAKSPMPIFRPSFDTRKKAGRNYVLGTKEALEHINRKGKWAVLASDSMRKEYALRRQKNADNVDPKKEFEWDSNMPDLVLAELRKSVLYSLNSIITNEPELVRKPSDDKEVQAEHVACVIRLHEEGEGAGTDLFEQMSEDGEYRPQEEIKAIYSETPSYDLSKFFPSEELDTFCSTNGISDSQLVLIKHTSTVGAIIWLERLQNYLQGSG